MDLAAAKTRLLQRSYDLQGSAMTFRSPVNNKSVTLQAIDRSAAATLDEKGLLVPTVKPCCTVLLSDLAAQNIPPEQMVDVNVSFAGNNWRVMAVNDKPDPSWRVMNGQLKPVPNWGQLGEILFTLMDVS